MIYLDVCAGISASTVAWKPLGWRAAAYSEIDPAPRAVLAHHYPDTPSHGDFTTIGANDYGPIDALVGALPAKISASPDCARAWMESVATSPLNSFGLLTESAPSGSFGRTSPASCQLTEGGHLVPSSEGWGSSGMGSLTEFWTLNSSEYHNAGGVCSLSAILETGDIPQRYYLSAKASMGILRRAEKRGKPLPKHLEKALTDAAAG